MAATSRSDMLESRRRAYLHALGIPQYHPRQQLPGAMPSTLLAGVSASPAPTAAAVKPADVSLAPSVTANTAAQRHSPSRPAAQAALAQLQVAAAPVGRAKPATPVSPAKPVPPATATPGRVREPQEPRQAVVAESMEAAQSVAFAFAFIPVNEQVAVINELPTAGAPTLLPGSRQLLAGILKALSLPSEERNLSSLSFVWPSPDLPPAEQGAAPARDLLRGFLARRFSIRPVQYLLVLAEQGVPYLFPDGFAINEGQLLRHPDFDVQVLATRSLGAMEAVPALKREVWSALQPLLRALQGEQHPDSRHDP